MSITVKNINKRYGNQQAVDDVSFTIPAGQTCGFLGPNGAGKSSTLKMITGFLTPDSGSILIDEIDMVKQPIEAKRKIGYLAEHNPVYKEMYVREFLQFAAKTHRIKNKKQAIARVIEQTGLQKEAHKRIGQLSKGYQQRVGLAQALVHEPSVLILDEPLSGLDPNQLEELRELIRELGQEKTVIFSSHILQEVEQVASRVLLIQDGKLVHDDWMEQKNETSTLVEFEEVLLDDIQTKLNHLGDFEIRNNQIHFAESGDQFRKAIFQFALEHSLTLLRLEETKSQLTDLFKKKTSR